MRTLPVVLVLIFLGAKSSKGCQNDVELTLYEDLLTKDLRLNVTVKFNRKRNSIKDTSIQCYQANNQKMKPPEGGELARVEHNKLDEQPGSFHRFYYYEVQAKIEGYYKCQIAFNSTSTNSCFAHSNEHFYRENNYVYAVLYNRKVYPSDVKNLLSHLNLTTNVSKGKNEKTTTFVSANILVSQVIHVTASTPPPYDKATDMKNLQFLSNSTSSQLSLEVQEVRSTRACPELTRGLLIRLPASDMKKWVVSNVNATFENGDLLRARCQGEFYSGAYWNSEDLRQIETFETTWVEQGTVAPVMSANKFGTQYEVQKFASKLATVTITGNSLADLADDVNLLLTNGTNALEKLQQASLNTSNEILASVDRALIEAQQLGDEALQAVIKPKFVARVEDLGVTQGVGVAVVDPKYDPMGDKTLSTDTELVTLTDQTTLQNLVKLEPRAALQLPPELLKHKSNRLAFLVYEGAALFKKGLETSAVVSATLGQQKHYDLAEPVKIWFRRDKQWQPQPGQCVSWDFSLDSGRGNWSNRGCYLWNVTHLSPISALDECRCSHLTHFGELFWNHDRPLTNDPLQQTHASSLQLLTQVSCIVSLAGLMGIFSTAIFAREWLQKGPGQKIQLQISISLALLLVLFLLTTQLKVTSTIAKVTLGVLLHYSLLSNFAWMALAAWLQHSRLVKVVTSRSSRLLLKAGIIGWVLPGLPPVLLLVMGYYREYTHPPVFLPISVAFHLTVVLPVILIMTVNVVVFLLIARSLSVNITIRRHDNRCLSLRRFKQLLFLFILLGLTWLLAVAQYVLSGSWRLLFSYLFCLTVGFQGLTYFVFFVVMDNKAKSAWRAKFCPKLEQCNGKLFTRRCTFMSFGQGVTESSINNSL